jgi:lactoylglutathione lyase
MTIGPLFEAHLAVANLDRAIAFYGGTLGLEEASVLRERGVAFYWLGGKGRSMLGLWESGTGPQRMRLHVAFDVGLNDVVAAPEWLSARGIEPLDFFGNPAREPSVIAWMPAAAVYFKDPDDNLLEFLAMLPDAARPEMGVVPWGRWKV